jgi:hypothetical protein
MIHKHQILFAAVLACSSSLGASTVLPDATYTIGMTFVPAVGDPSANRPLAPAITRLGAPQPS